MEKSNPCHILLILTGGTICSFADESGVRHSDAEQAQTLIVRHFREGDSPLCGEDAVRFDCRRPLDVLSENMTVAHWNTLMDDLKSCDLSRYDGVIVLHGTDTLAYTACLLALVLDGTRVPVFLVSAQLPIYMPESNGDHNFRAAVELIAQGIKPAVYAVYRNDDGITYLHNAAHLRQCTGQSVNFYSADMVDVQGSERPIDGDGNDGELPLYRIGDLTDCVLAITPHVGLQYDRFSLNGVRAVLQQTYHSGTAEVAGVLSLKARCDKAQPPIPLFLTPCESGHYAYETTGALLRAGAFPIWGMTDEMAYVKLMVGCALGLQEDALMGYLEGRVNRERDGG